MRPHLGQIDDVLQHVLDLLHLAAAVGTLVQPRERLLVHVVGLPHESALVARLAARLLGLLGRLVLGKGRRLPAPPPNKLLQPLDALGELHILPAQLRVLLAKRFVLPPKLGVLSVGCGFDLSIQIFSAPMSRSSILVGGGRCYPRTKWVCLPPKALTSTQLFGVGPWTDDYLARYSGSGTTWALAGEGASELFGGGSSMYRLTNLKDAIQRYDGDYNWTTIGGAGRQFLATSANVYGLRPDRSWIMKYNTTQWNSIHGSAARLYGSSGYLFATSETDETIEQYNAATSTWTSLGKP